MKMILASAAALAVAVASPALSQSRAVTTSTQTTPPSRDFQPVKPDPVITRLNTLQQELDALKETAGKQVVVLHFSPTEHPGSPDNNYNTNQAFATDACEKVLGDRFGRMIGYRVWTNGDRFFLTHISCETKL
jgi:hypothetical protein